MKTHSCDYLWVSLICIPNVDQRKRGVDFVSVLWEKLDCAVICRPITRLSNIGDFVSCAVEQIWRAENQDVWIYFEKVVFIRKNTKMATQRQSKTHRKT